MADRVPTVEILGVPISRITPTSALAAIEGWVDAKAGAYVCACDVHSLMRARSDPTHLAALRGAALVTPDGQPVVWSARARGIADMSRVCGPDLLPLVCRTLAGKTRHYFLGGATGVAEQLAAKLKRDIPTLDVVGTESPPYREPTADERAATIERIKRSGANIVWIGLGCPKQERWMLDHHDRLPGVVLVGVGAAFDFHTERVRRAPPWMRDNGLEWLHRLVSEPRRLWQRYLVLAPRFAVASAIETMLLRRRALKSDKSLTRAS